MARHTYLDFVPRQRFQPALALSPDAGTVAYSGNAGGHFGLWTMPAAGGPAQRVAELPGRAVRQIAWTPDGKDLVFTADLEGDEQYRIYRAAADGAEPVEIGGGPDCQRILAAAPFDATGRYLAYAANDRDPAVQDLLVRDLDEGTERRISPPDGVVFEPTGISPDGRWLLAAGSTSNTDVAAYLVDLTDPASEARCVTARHGQGIFAPRGWAPDSGGFYLLTNVWSEFTAAAFQPLDRDGLEVVARYDWDVELLEAAGDTLAWAVNEAGRSVLHLRRDGVTVIHPGVPPGVITALALAPDGGGAVLLIDAATRPTELAAVDLAGGFRYLTDARPPALRVIDPVEPESITYPASGGREVHALLYRPGGPGPHPVVLSIHGGPEGQERPGYLRSGLYQHLLNQGIAVFAPNIAGSTGYGIAHQKLIYRDWGGIDLDDLDHAVRHLRTRPGLDAGRIAAMGGSYGGFAALSCVARLPYPWAACVSICGPTNLVTLAKGAPPTWKTLVRTVLGDPDTDAEFLLRRSPVTHAGAITAPLFVLQGARDPRVPRSESDQLVSRLRERGVQVRYDVFPDEGHGFTNRDNELKAYGEIARFLTDHLRACGA
ncbi:S9 family peptidase [Actinomadura macrotermitis]|uniref:S9 family peptidase n=1 Tax=Actinomadura macrotermitis TaxID=2585200 RepID=UPI001886669F|nr:S9 family peptidase [Actinomadura macrotermitis]